MWSDETRVRWTYIAWDWQEGDLYLLSREKTSTVVEDCVTLALQSETCERKKSWIEIQNC